MTEIDTGPAELLPRVALGETGLELTRIGFGAAPLGNLYAPVEESRSDQLLAALIESPIRYFDTAPFYGFGLSERRLGDALRALPRATFALSTKVGRLIKPLPGHAGFAVRQGYATPMPFEPVYDYSYDAIMRSYEDSQQRLGLAEIDLLYVHDIGRLTHGDANDAHFRMLAESGYRALEELRASGAVKAVGLGVNEYEICEQAMETGQFDCFMLAGRYSLLEQEPLASFFPKCEAHGARIVAAGVYNSGILATGVKGDGPHYYNYEPAPAEIIQKTARIEKLCEVHGVSLPAAAMQFVLAHPIVVSACIGFGKAARVDKTLELYHAAIPDRFWSDLKGEGLIDADAPTPVSKEAHEP
ncbi:MAG: aldo/keto reductase [Sphingomonadales bacterium]|nr:aldo/keto reductase [Sphingomonadales bacterium]